MLRHASGGESRTCLQLVSCQRAKAELSSEAGFSTHPLGRDSAGRDGGGKIGIVLVSEAILSPDDGGDDIARQAGTSVWPGRSGFARCEEAQAAVTPGPQNQRPFDRLHKPHPDVEARVT